MNRVTSPRLLHAQRLQIMMPALAGLTACLVTTPAQSQIGYSTLDYGANATFLTGIRGNNIVGNYVIPNGSGNTGGLLYNQSSGAWTLFPVLSVRPRTC